MAVGVVFLSWLALFGDAQGGEQARVVEWELGNGRLEVYGRTWAVDRSGGCRQALEVRGLWNEWAAGPKEWTGLEQGDHETEGLMGHSRGEEKRGWFGEGWEGRKTKDSCEQRNETRRMRRGGKRK